jgi:hypothetical protein
MNRYLQDFFWMPEEMTTWIMRVMSQYHLWAVMCESGSDALPLPIETIRPRIFDRTGEDSIQIFLGSWEIAKAPVWREAGKRRLLNFQESYAVQLIPSLYDSIQKILLLGQMAILHSKQYDDRKKAADLIALFHQLRDEMTKSSDSSRVVVQMLSNGRKKFWKDILVGRQVPGGDAVSLKQFARGEVTFDLFPAGSDYQTKIH